ncbi:MAG: hypothetical protein KDH15_22850 [Rhodocyclaceae bacterium]|nr:hypothetical protein [Rhodocyclaceae bacterium]
MSKLNDSFVRRLGTSASGLIGVLLLASLPATVQAAGGHPGAIGSGNSAGAHGKAGARTYELRCWQEGRLILQERVLRLPGSGPNVLRMQDHNGRPVRVLETGNATCLIKTSAPRRPRLP